MSDIQYIKAVVSKSIAIWLHDVCTSYDGVQYVINMFGGPRENQTLLY